MYHVVGLCDRARRGVEAEPREGRKGGTYGDEGAVWSAPAFALLRHDVE